MPAVVVLTEVFTNLGVSAARARGFGELRTLVLPHPMESRPDDEIVAIARARFDDVVRLLSAPA